MQFSKAFVRFNWAALVMIYLVVIAGSFVRISGSGMGCPDWPKCFGKWIPPTSAKELPANYKEIFLDKRTKKVEKFNRLLKAIGMKKTADKLNDDPDIDKEESFNARKTWVEYINRLIGFIGGNMLLFGFGWFLLNYRKSRLTWLAGLNCIVIGIEAWFGSIVVATNLTPWTITIHLLLALLIIGIQIYIIHKISPVQSKKLIADKMLLMLVIIVFLITFYQLFLGTQVRESIDELTKQGFGRASWTDKLGWPFYIHRSFSWLVLIALTYMAIKNEKKYKIQLIRSAFLILIIELISGILLAYADMPGLVQTSHLIFASILFGILWMGVLRIKKG